MTISLREAMDEASIGSLQWTMAGLLFGVMMLDGLDYQLAGFAAPLLMGEWHLSKPEFAPLLAAAMIGMAIGSLIGSWFGDRYGRKPTIVASMAFFGVMTIVCAGAIGPKTFIAYRFLCGLGLGAAFPVATTLMSEWMPPRAAGKAISIMTIGIPAGIMLGASAASWFLPRFGWQYGFAGTGALCVLFSVCLLWKLPESPSYLILRNRHQAAYGLLARAWNRPVQADVDLFRLEPKREAGRGLFRRSNARVNAGLWLGVLFASCATYAIAGWLTVILVGLQLPLATALRGSLAVNVSAICGALIVGWVLARLGSRLTMLLLSLLSFAAAGTMSAAAYGFFPDADLFLVLFVGLAIGGFVSGSLQPAFYYLAASAYDTGIRATGVGVAAVMGRLGAILSSFVGGAVLAVGHEGGFFALIAALAVASTCAILIFDRHVPALGGEASDVTSSAAAAQKN